VPEVQYLVERGLPNLQSSLVLQEFGAQIDEPEPPLPPALPPLALFLFLRVIPTPRPIAMTMMAIMIPTRMKRPFLDFGMGNAANRPRPRPALSESS
jgi:hypothetical protein